MAVQYGLAMTNFVKKDGHVCLGLVGSGLTERQCKRVFRKIAAKKTVELVSLEPEVGIVFKVK